MIICDSSNIYDIKFIENMTNKQIVNLITREYTLSRAPTNCWSEWNKPWISSVYFWWTSSMDSTNWPGTYNTNHRGLFKYSSTSLSIPLSLLSHSLSLSLLYNYAKTIAFTCNMYCFNFVKTIALRRLDGQQIKTKPSLKF